MGLYQQVTVTDSAHSLTDSAHTLTDSAHSPTDSAHSLTLGGTGNYASE